MATKERTACGFVLVRDRKGVIEYLSLTNAKRDEPGLPKGHADAGETEMETALRETYEETALDDLKVLGDFRRTLRYKAKRTGKTYDKRVVYFAARARSGKIELSKEHSQYAWLPLGAMLDTMPHANLRRVIRDAALFLKDPSLFELEPATEQEGLRYLKSLPHARKKLVAHLRGGARLARTFAEALSAAGERVHVEATAAGTVLHDVGRAIGEHDDHQRAGVRLLRKTSLAAYGFACVSHFTKGARGKELRAAGVERDVVADFKRMTDLCTFTWEEQCAALADACMKGDEAVPPRKRFRDLRRRYDAPDLIDLQERNTKRIRKRFEEALGEDPLALVGLD